MAGAITLGQVAERAAVLEVACDRCGRRGRYGTAGLVERHGAGTPMPDLRRLLAADCPRWASSNIYDLCGVHYPGAGGAVPPALRAAPESAALRRVRLRLEVS